jgi:uncharacterized glyoxalase superfamily protein PhnB
MDAMEPHPVINATEAQLFVANLQTALDFYTTKLGFTVAFIYGDYGQVVRDQARLNLRVINEPVFAGDIREREQLLSASLTLATAAEIKQLYTTYEAADVPFSQPLYQAPWGALVFILRDPDGNLILFASPPD